MSAAGLQPFELDQLCSVFRRHPEISQVKVFGSRAKGTHQPSSDVDLALWGVADDFAAQAIALELDELSLPYNYDVKAFAAIRLPNLREHIERVGRRIWPTSKT
jgi:predicted nucleotidyltransferase